MHDPGPITNALTIDVVEDFSLQGLGLCAIYQACSEWDSRECRVERNVDRATGPVGR